MQNLSGDCAFAEQSDSTDTGCINTIKLPQHKQQTFRLYVPQGWWRVENQLGNIWHLKIA